MAAPLRPTFRVPQMAGAPGPIALPPLPVNPLSLAPESDVLTRVAGFFCCIYLFLTYSRAMEFLPIPLILLAVGGFTGLAIALSGGLLASMRTRSGVLLTVLTLCIVAAIPFSEWPRLSLDIFNKSWLRSVAVFFFIAGAITGLQSFRRLLLFLALAVPATLLEVQIYGAPDDTGRLGLEGTTIGNPNDLATHLLMGLPFLIYAVRSYGLFSVWGLLCGASIPILVADVFRTGSRAGLISLTGFVLYVFIRGSGLIRVSMIAMVIAALLLVPVLLPDTVTQRFSSMFGEKPANTREMAIAEGSAEARLEILIASVKAALTHPLLGVGPGGFQAYHARVQGQANKSAYWNDTHNTFTQMASEVGIPAGLIYTVLLIGTVRRGAQAMKLGRRLNNPQLTAIGDAIIMAVLCFALAAFFGNYAYMFYMPLLVALTEVLRRITEREIQANPTAAIPPSSAAVPGIAPPPQSMAAALRERRKSSFPPIPSPIRRA
ncbi:MAG: O-antigen ligase family protein [Bryobacteraceae bacterium]|nr:O-antigen ligase family protein [Bryobacteraceae bacterium]